MADCSNHCPFLNRGDPRCAQHLSMRNLDHAYRYCFAHYTLCGLYLDRLLERRAKAAPPPRAAQAHLPVGA